MAPRARFELARERSHGLSRPAQYQAMRPRLGPSNRLPVFTMTILAGGAEVCHSATIKPIAPVRVALPLWLRGIASPW